MKKLIAALLAAALLGLCLGGGAMASDNVKFKASAFVYDEAGGQPAGIVIRRGSVTEYVAQIGGWVQVKIGKTLGWVPADCLMATGDSVQVLYSAAPVEDDAVTALSGQAD